MAEVNKNCYYLSEISNKCKILRPNCSCEGCGFFQKAQQAKDSKEKANARLRSLPDNKSTTTPVCVDGEIKNFVSPSQAYIANKYYDDCRPWNINE